MIASTLTPIEAPVIRMKLSVPAAYGTNSAGTEFMLLKFKDGMTKPNPTLPNATKSAIIQKLVNIPMSAKSQQDKPKMANPTAIV